MLLLCLCYRLAWQAGALCSQVVRSFVRSSVRPFDYKTCEHNILQMDESLLMLIDTNGLRGN